MTVITLLIFGAWLIAWGSCGAFCAWLAGEKNRNGTSWFFLGFFFGWVALIALAGSPLLTEERKAELAEKKKAEDDESMERAREAVRAAMAQQENDRDTSKADR